MTVRRLRSSVCGQPHLHPVLQQELISQAGLDSVQDPSHEERVHQYSQVSLQGELLEKGWCSLVPQLLQSAEHDYREKVEKSDRDK